ncbi:hypothetical protein ACFUIW_04320 [Streptomyces sp. NPDC057245]|uniref:hypothetical protein n=1 Tax=Streptomyces TaxID=1883 RepID=UPI001C1DE1EE|nr:hypothetical protein [Streptomyces sp. A108]MBU6530526.1 hypothetical protein [Streptomyces sp. A108]
MHNSPWWWLFAALGALFWYAVMLPAMPTAKHRALVSLGPPLTLVPLAAYSLKAGEPLTGLLPVYCALVASVPVGILGHGKRLRAVLSDPDVPYDEATGPWTLQAACAMALFVGLAAYYVSR